MIKITSAACAAFMFLAPCAMAQTSGELFHSMRPAPVSKQTEKVAEAFDLCLYMGSIQSGATRAVDRIQSAMHGCNRIWEKLLETYDHPLDDSEKLDLLARFATKVDRDLQIRLGPLGRYYP